MNKISVAIAVAAVTGAFTLAGCKSGDMNMDGLLTAGQSAVTAATLTDEQVKQIGDKTIAELDSQNKIAPANNKYTTRLNKIVSSWKQIDGQTFEYKVYLTSDVNAFAVPNGSVRVYSGLMDKMTDDELRYVMGHEVGHVILGHSKKAMQTAYATLAARQAAAASGNSTAVTLSNSQLAELGDALIQAQFSQSQETASDDFALSFLKARNLNQNAAVTALKKLDNGGSSTASLFSSHPAPAKRAARMQQMIDQGK